MSSYYNASQYNDSFKPSKLKNWRVVYDGYPGYFAAPNVPNCCRRPIEYIANNCGHLLNNCPASKCSSPWGDFPGSIWEESLGCDCTDRIRNPHKYRPSSVIIVGNPGKMKFPVIDQIKPGEMSYMQECVPGQMISCNPCGQMEYSGQSQSGLLKCGGSQSNRSLHSQQSDRCGQNSQRSFNSQRPSPCNSGRSRQNLAKSMSKQNCQTNMCADICNVYPGMSEMARQQAETYAQCKTCLSDDPPNQQRNGQDCNRNNNCGQLSRRSPSQISNSSSKRREKKMQEQCRQNLVDHFDSGCQFQDNDICEPGCERPGGPRKPGDRCTHQMYGTNAEECRLCLSDKNANNKLQQYSNFNKSQQGQSGRCNENNNNNCNTDNYNSCNNNGQYSCNDQKDNYKECLACLSDNQNNRQQQGNSQSGGANCCNPMYGENAEQCRICLSNDQKRQTFQNCDNNNQNNDGNYYNNYSSQSNNNGNCNKNSQNNDNCDDNYSSRSNNGNCNDNYSSQNNNMNCAMNNDCSGGMRCNEEETQPRAQKSCSKNLPRRVCSKDFNDWEKNILQSNTCPFPIRRDFQETCGQYADPCGNYCQRQPPVPSRTCGVGRVNNRSSAEMNNDNCWQERPYDDSYDNNNIRDPNRLNTDCGTPNDLCKEKFQDAQQGVCQALEDASFAACRKSMFDPMTIENAVRNSSCKDNSKNVNMYSRRGPDTSKRCGYTATDECANSSFCNKGRIVGGLQVDALCQKQADDWAKLSSYNSAPGEEKSELDCYREKSEGSRGTMVVEYGKKMVNGELVPNYTVIKVNQDQEQNQNLFQQDWCNQVLQSNRINPGYGTTILHKT